MDSLGVLQIADLKDHNHSILKLRQNGTWYSRPIIRGPSHKLPDVRGTADTINLRSLMMLHPALSSATATVSSELSLAACSVTRMQLRADSTTNSDRDNRIQASLRHASNATASKISDYFTTVTTNCSCQWWSQVASQNWWSCLWPVQRWVSVSNHTAPVRTGGAVCGQCNSGCEYTLILPPVITDDPVCGQCNAGCQYPLILPPCENWRVRNTCVDTQCEWPWCTTEISHCTGLTGSELCATSKPRLSSGPYKQWEHSGWLHAWRCVRGRQETHSVRYRQDVGPLGTDKTLVRYCVLKMI